MRQYTAILQAVFEADSDVDALLVADSICEHGKFDLQPEDGDSVDVVGVNLTQFGSRAAMVWYMRQTRDMLIKTKIRTCYDMGHELDRLAWIFEHKAEDHFDAAGYDHGEFMSHAKKILGGEDGSQS